jgi:hypothetical protein
MVSAPARHLTPFRYNASRFILIVIENAPGGAYPDHMRPRLPG